MTELSGEIASEVDEGPGADSSAQVVEQSAPARLRTPVTQKLDKIESLERFLREGGICHKRPLAGGGGHPQQHKMTLFLAGGVAVAAKAGADDEMLRRARREVAAWILAADLGFPWLVPTTVLRTIPTSITEPEEVEGSVQILWPQFSTALDRRIDASYVDEVHAWPVALFDALAANTDRALDNWGTVKDIGNAVLIDHGHAFAGDETDSEFVRMLSGEPLSPTLQLALERLIAHRSKSRLSTVLDEIEVDGVFRRAEDVANAKQLSIGTT